MEKIIHQIWVGPLDMPVEEKYFVRDIKLKNPSWNHILWSDQNLPDLPDNIKKMYDIFGKDKLYAFQADLLRLFVVKKYGGLYLDVDFQFINGFDGIENYDDFFCEWNNLILNGVFGAKKNHKLLIKACKEINTNNRWYGPTWFTKVIGIDVKNKITLHNFESKYAKHHALGSWIKK